jgi:hypothetical protein
MCITNPKPCKITNIFAYKIMQIPFRYRILKFFGMKPRKVKSFAAKNVYKFNKIYYAGNPKCKRKIEKSDEYDVGFHAYEHKKDAFEILNDYYSYSYRENFLVVVKVKLHDVFLSGYELRWNALVAKKCRFLEIIECDE